MAEKICPRCGGKGPFFKHRDGHDSFCKACKREWRKAHPDIIREIKRRYREKNKEQIRQYRETNREKVRESYRRWLEANPERARQIASDWRKAHPDKIKEYTNNRRALELGALGMFSAQEWEFLQEEYAYLCAYCGTKPESLEADHIVPLSRGGTNDISNIVPACRSCNRSKNNTSLLMWMYKNYSRG